MNCYIVGERGSAYVSNRIAALTHRYVKAVLPAKHQIWSHVLLAFGNGFGFESHMQTGGFFSLDMGKHVEKSTAQAWHVRLPLSDVQVESVYQRCIQSVGFHDYDTALIVQLRAAATFAFVPKIAKMLVMKNSAKWDCSEGVSRLLVEVIDLRKLTAKYSGSTTHFDLIMPGMIQAHFEENGMVQKGYPEVFDNG